MWVKRRYFIFTVFWILINSFQKSTLFTDEEVRTMFSMFDITGRKTITSDQYRQGAPLFSPQHLSSFLFSLFQLRATCVPAGAIDEGTFVQMGKQAFVDRAR